MAPHHSSNIVIALRDLFVAECANRGRAGNRARRAKYCNGHSAPSLVCFYPLRTCPRRRRVFVLASSSHAPRCPYGNMPHMEVFLLWATLGVYAVGVIAVVLAALLFASAGKHDLG